MGLGAFPAPHPQWLGMLGMHGTRAANYAMDEADLIVAVGARFDDRITGKLSEFAPRAKFIHIDIDPAEISKNVPAHIPIVGDASASSPRLVAEYERSGPTRRGCGWWERIDRWRSQHPLRYDDSTDTEIKPQRGDRGALRGHGRATRSCPSDVGQHQMWTAQYFHFAEPRHVDQLRAASGRWASACRRRSAPRWRSPDELVVLRLRRRLDPDEHPGAGDDPRERAAGEDPRCLNNGFLGMVRQWQELFWDRRYSAVDTGHGRTSSSSPRPTASPGTG